MTVQSPKGVLTLARAGDPLREVVEQLIEEARADPEIARERRDDVLVTAGDLEPEVWAQLAEAAVLAGIAARVLDDAVAYVRERARPIKHSSASTSVDDPYVRQTVGEIAARAQAARAVVLFAAETLQGVEGLRGVDTGSAREAAAVHVAQAGVVALESALRAAELLFDVGGGSITNRSLAFDRHWRNARTAGTHQTRQSALAAAGHHHLNRNPTERVDHP